MSDAVAETRAGLAHALLEVPHAFGTSQSVAPEDVRRPQQVHGARVLRDTSAASAADAILTTRPGRAVGILTADCVPILAVAGAGKNRAALAIHAGWRGLAAGVIANAFRALAETTGDAPPRAVVGPCARACCYEVDTRVLRALDENFATALPAATTPTRPGHAMLDLATLAEAALQAARIAPENYAVLQNACTICNATFESHRRNPGKKARMLHWIKLP